MKMPLWIPDGEEGWILSFPSGLFIWFEEDQKEVWGVQGKALLSKSEHAEPP